MGKKRFAEYSWSSQNRLRLPRLQIISAENETGADDLARVPRPSDQSHNIADRLEHEQGRLVPDELESDTEQSNISDQNSPSASTDGQSISRNSEHSGIESDCDPMGHERTRAPYDDEDSQESNQMHGESFEESVFDVSSDDSYSLYSQDEDDHCEHENCDEQAPLGNDEPLYEGAPLTMAESNIAILSLALRHNITGVLLSDILHLIAMHCPPDNKCKTTLYTFKKFFSESQTPLVRHYYCSECLKSVERQDSICPNCTSAEMITYFIEGPIISQLKALFKRPGFHESLQHRDTRERENPENFEDIYDGAVYKDLIKDDGFLNNRNNISLTWYTDGIRIFKSSNFNIWPLYLVINELPFSERTKKENIILAGLWFGEKKPIPNVFLAPLRDSTRQLREGIDVYIPNAENPINVKGLIICGTCDLPAKALFLNMKQYNGTFGCQKCKQKGKYSTEARTVVYPYEPLRLRTDEETAEHARQAFNIEGVVCGVKGASMLSTIVHENIRATAIDVMHCVDEGVTKNLLNFWFSPRFSGHPSSLVQHRELVDQRLKSLTPPSFVQRLPRSLIEHLPYMKAYELKALLFYYAIPCINDIMKCEYLEHFKLLVFGLFLLCKASVSAEEIELGARALQEFVFRFEHLYGKRYMTNNLHQLLHLPENVRQFGPLWTTSCYPFEDLNGRLKTLVHGSNSAQLQIYNGVSMHLHLTSLKGESVVEGGAVHEFCENLESRRGRIKRHVISDSACIVGKYTKLRHITPELQHVFATAEIQGVSFVEYHRLLQKNVMYSSTEYRRSKRTNSAFAIYSVAGAPSRIGQIRCFVRISDCVCPALCGCPTQNYAILRACIVENQFTTCIDNQVLSNVHTFLECENDEQAVDIICLKSVCFYCHIQDTSKTYIIEPVNRKEWE